MGVAGWGVFLMPKITKSTKLNLRKDAVPVVPRDNQILEHVVDIGSFAWTAPILQASFERAYAAIVFGVRRLTGPINRVVVRPNPFALDPAGPPTEHRKIVTLVFVVDQLD